MALTYVSNTYDTRTENSIDIGSDEIILEKQLTAFDEKHLEAAIAAGLANYTMPNGTTADVYFAKFTRTAAEITTQYAKARLKTGTATTLESFETQLADHETRITALEP